MELSSISVFEVIYKTSVMIKVFAPQTKLHFQWMGVVVDNLTPQIKPW